jgi:hypothetical protein
VFVLSSDSRYLAFFRALSDGSSGSWPASCLVVLFFLSLKDRNCAALAIIDDLRIPIKKPIRRFDPSAGIGSNLVDGG